MRADGGEATRGPGPRRAPWRKGLVALAGCMWLAAVGGAAAAGERQKHAAWDATGQVTATKQAECLQPRPVLYRPMSGLRSRTMQVVGDRRQWCELWAQMHFWLMPRPPCDTSLIDFHRQVAIVAALGSRPNTCYGVAVTNVCRLTKAHVEVDVVEFVPGPRCGCGMAITHPVAVVVVERPVETASFSHRIVVSSCAVEHPTRD